MRPFVIGFSILVLTIASAQAQECSRVGAETCMNGAIYQCMQTAGVKGWILRAPYEKCQVQQKSCAEMAREFEAQVAVFNRKCDLVAFSLNVRNRVNCGNADSIHFAPCHVVFLISAVETAEPALPAVWFG
jgi:hypothetical protein